MEEPVLFTMLYSVVRSMKSPVGYPIQKQTEETSSVKLPFIVPFLALTAWNFSSNIDILTSIRLTITA